MNARRLSLAAGVASVTCLASVACSLVVSTDGLVGARPASDGSVNADGSPAPSDGSVLTDTGPPPLPDAGAPIDVADTQSITSSTGVARQTRMVFAQGRFWFFFVTSADSTSVHTRWSTDFTTWKDGPALSMPKSHGGDGRNLSVATKSIGGTDVLHLVYGSRGGGPGTRFHARGAFDPNGVTLGTAVEINSIGLGGDDQPDEPVTAITKDNTVVDVSSWAANVDSGSGSRNAYAWETASPDPGGATWSPSWGPQLFLGFVPNLCNAHALVPLPSGRVFALWEHASAEPDPDGVDFSLRTQGAWSGQSPVARGGSQSLNDWAAIARAEDDVHFVRRDKANAFTHRRFGASGWTDGAPIPSDAGAVGSGLVMTTDGTNVSVYAIASDGAVRTIRWSGSTWGSWSTLVAGGAQRSYLSVASFGTRAAVLWTEPVGGSSHAFAYPVAP